MASSPNEFAVPDKVRDVTLDDDPILLHHVKRPQWGLAILAWDRGERRAYQFEDGRMREFKKGYYDLLKPGEPSNRSAEAIITDLQAAIGAPTSAGKILEPVASFDQQIELLRTLFPGGFVGDGWIAEHRGSATGRGLKRHRDPVIRAAQETLSSEACAAWIASGKHAALANAVFEVLSNTSVVGLGDIKTLREMDAETTVQFAEAVADLLYGEGDLAPRFKTWVKVLEQGLGSAPSWRLATAIPALVQPEQHVCVRHSAFIRLAAVIAPTAHYSRQPTSRSYRNFLRVARVAFTRLEAAGLAPRDLMDIHDFVWVTLRDSALEQLTA